MAEGRYRGLDSAERSSGRDRRAAILAHNAGVPADAQDDTCPCQQCRNDDLPPAARCPADRPPPSPPFSADVRRPVTSFFDGAAPRAPVLRGPVQDESGALDPLDAQALRAVEGREREEACA